MALPDPAVTVSFDPTGNRYYCLIHVDLLGFESSTTYPVTVGISSSSTGPATSIYNAALETDALGFASGYPIGSFFNINRYVQVTSNGIITAFIPITC